jgi:hypothetical protein
MPTLPKPTSCFVTSSTRSNARIRTLSKSSILSINYPLLAGPARRSTSVTSLSGPTSPLPKRAIRSRCSYAVRHHHLHLALARSAVCSSVLIFPPPPFSLFVFARGRNRPADTSHCSRGGKGWYEAGRNRWFPQGATSRIY